MISANQDKYDISTNSHQTIPKVLWKDVLYQSGQYDNSNAYSMCRRLYLMY